MKRTLVWTVAVILLALPFVFTAVIAIGVAGLVLAVAIDIRF